MLPRLTLQFDDGKKEVAESWYYVLVTYRLAIITFTSSTHIRLSVSYVEIVKYQCPHTLRRIQWRQKIFSLMNLRHTRLEIQNVRSF